jgi:hypothetical protein
LDGKLSVLDHYRRTPMTQEGEWLEIKGSPSTEITERLIEIPTDSVDNLYLDPLGCWLYRHTMGGQWFLFVRPA